jgi:aminoglycoside phosphotransferase (APT) family kinase protein
MIRDRLPPEIAAALGLSAEAALSPAPQGMTSEVAFVDDGGMRAVLKRCRDPRYVEWLRRERDVLVALATAPLPIPRVLGYHAAAGETDVWLLTTRLPGESLWAVLLRSEPFDRSALFHTVGRLLRELHATPAPEAFHTATPWIDRMLARARENLDWCDGSPRQLAHVEAHRPTPGPECLIHGDAALDNLLVDGEGRVSVIDWSGGDLGDPRYDIALALGTEPEFTMTQTDRAAFFAGYGRPPLAAATLRWFLELYEFF